ncbi:MAG TPA: hypothetical protein VIH59_20190 [Candidatus Tectomicrobia bacterium]|jgi:hypothetical protein
MIIDLDSHLREGYFMDDAAQRQAERPRLCPCASIFRAAARSAGADS